MTTKEIIEKQRGICLKMNKKGEKNKGITLVALIVTIIVLLILAGISIRILGGENGLITRTKIAKEESKRAEYKERITMAKTEAIISNEGKDIDLDEYIEQIKSSKIKGIKSIEKITNYKAKIVTEEGYIFLVTLNTIEDYENENNTPEISIKDANIEFTFDPNTWTSGSVKVTVTQKESKYVIQLSKDAISWETTNKIEFTENGVVYARVKDSEGRVSDYASRKISIIDTESPVINTSLTGTGTTNSITLNIGVSDSQSGVNKIIWYYKLSDATTYTNATDTYTATTANTTRTHTFTGLEQNKTYKAYAVVYDAVGRNKQSGTIDVTTVSVATASGATYTPSEWTNGDVTVTLPTKSGYSTLYTTDGTLPTNTSTKYTSEITLKSNCVINYVYSDGTNIGGAGTVNVTNIDKEKPVLQITLAGSKTGEKWIVISSASDNKGSGFYGYAVNTRPNIPETFTKFSSSNYGSTGTGGTGVCRANLPDTTYYVWLKDIAGNISEYASVKTDPTLVAKVNVGDYVNYDATSKYTYTSVTGTGSSHGSGYTGTSSSTGSGSITSYSQKFTSSSSIKWRVLSKDISTGEVVLISEAPIKTDAGSDYYLGGTIGYLYAEEELNRICSIYGHGAGADTSKTFSFVTGDLIEGTTTGTLTGSGARSINVDDINKICGVTPSKVSSNYGKSYTHSIYYPTKKTSTGKSTSVASRTDINTYCIYSSLAYLSDTTSLYKTLFKKTNSSNTISYLLASRSVNSNSSNSHFCVYSVSRGSLVWSDEYLYSSSAGFNACGYGVRPIVYLKSNIQTSGQDSSGAWNIVSE